MKTGETVKTVYGAALAEKATFTEETASGENLPLKVLKPDVDLQPGDLIFGTFKKGEKMGKYKTLSYIIATDTQDILLNGCGKLNKEIREKNVQPGDLIRIEYRGSNIIKEGDHKGTKSYLYKVTRADAADASDESADESAS